MDVAHDEQYEQDQLDEGERVITSALYLDPNDPTPREKRAKQEVDRIEYKGGEILTQRIVRDGPTWLIQTEWAAPKEQR